MKLTIILTTILLPIFTLAGGGGGLRPGSISLEANLIGNGGEGDKPTGIVYHMGQKDGLINFAYGQLVNNQWKIQNLQIPQDELYLNPAVVKALQDSVELKTWVEVR